MRRHGVAALCLFAASCAATTGLVSTWRDPSYSGREVKRALVIGLTPKPENQQVFEQAMADRLEKIHVQAFKAFEVLPRGQMADQQSIAAAVQKHGIEVVLVTKVVAIRKEVEYVASAYAPPPSYYGMYPYYSAGYSAVYSPGYVTQTDSVYLETNAYDVQSQKLVWSGVTKTFDYSSVADISSSAAKKIVSSLLDQGVL